MESKAPKGYRKTEGATTAPNGYEWYNNGESRFSGKRKIALVKINKPCNHEDGTEVYEKEYNVFSLRCQDCKLEVE